MKIKRVEIIGDEPGWKGTWYNAGERHFVQDETWSCSTSRWSGVDICGGIMGDDARLLTGFSNWLACLKKTIRVILKKDSNYAHS